MNNHPYIKHPETIEEQQKSLDENKNGLTKIFFMLRRNSGIDFRHYKAATINRRIRRRMLLHKLTSLNKYVDYLRDNSDEIESLHDDLLINRSHPHLGSGVCYRRGGLLDCHISL